MMFVKAALLTASLLLSPSVFANPSNYRIGPQDTLRLRVYEWRSAIGEVFKWKSLTGEFKVGALGEVSLPLVGNLNAAGLTTTELADLISSRIKTHIGLAAPPVVALEVAEYRPFYIVGSVDKAGAYPYQPGLTVLQAVGLAGGLPRVTDVGILRLGRDVIEQKGELKQHSTKTKELLARKARLMAELKDTPQVNWPPELEARRSDPIIDKILEQEQAIFDSRRKALKTELAALENLKGTLDGEITSLGSQLTVQMKEQDAVKQELTSIAGLVRKGLAAAPRQLGLERTVAQLQGEHLRLKTTLLKARQEISRADISIIEVRNKWSNEVTASLRETEASLEETAKKHATAEGLLYEAEVLMPRLLLSRRTGQIGDAAYTIVRVVDGGAQTLKASEATPVLPGDTIKVDLPTDQDGMIDSLAVQLSREATAAPGGS